MPDTAPLTVCSSKRQLGLETDDVNGWEEEEEEGVIIIMMHSLCLIAII